MKDSVKKIEATIPEELYTKLQSSEYKITEAVNIGLEVLLNGTEKESNMELIQAKDNLINNLNIKVEA